ncbi:MAG: hypothetical protein U5L02_17940, partial [Rheinheimera sp.]|nr:hypothetical protein [Rheinheimera sp.]
QDKRLTIQALTTIWKAHAAARLLVNNTQRVAALVQGFKQVMVDRTAIGVRGLELMRLFR